MQLTNKVCTALVAAVLASACLGFASRGSQKERGVNITLTSATRFKNGDVLPAGAYHMEVAEASQNPSVKFYKEDMFTRDWGGHAVASTTVKAVPETDKNRHTEIDSVTRGNAQVIKVIRPRGWREKLVFGSNNTSNG